MIAGEQDLKVVQNSSFKQTHTQVTEQQLMNKIILKFVVQNGVFRNKHGQK